MGLGSFGKGLVTGGVSSGLDYLGNKSLQDDAQSFSKWMSRNKYQSAVTDLKAAGLNPMLAIGGGGGIGGGSGGTPSGGSTRNQIAANVSAKAASKKATTVPQEIKTLESMEFKNMWEGDRAMSAAYLNATENRIRQAQEWPLTTKAGIEADFYETDLGRLSHQISLGMQSAGAVGGAIVGTKKLYDASKMTKGFKKYPRRKPPRQPKFNSPNRR